MRVGQGFDAHRLVAGRPLMLGGIEVSHDRGLEGHSDGDVLLHAIADALLGAAGAGDLGRRFPSSRRDLEGIASGAILAEVAEELRERGFEIVNLDATIVAEAPRLAGVLDKMAEAISSLLAIETRRVSVKVTSTDGLGSIGRGDGIAALAVALIEEGGTEGGG